MLTSRFGDVLPQGRLTYVAFRLTAMAALAELDTADLDEEGDEPAGFLGAHVPLLGQVPLGVQLDLLGESWARHRAPQPVPATLLDGALLYAACERAAALAEDQPGICRNLLRGGPRRVYFTARTPDQLRDLFDEFWGDTDWTWLEDHQDADPEQLRAVLRLVNVDEEEVRQLYDALGRGRVSPALAANLAGLLTEAEVADCLEALRRTRG
jgi:hypothetical protein